MQKLMMKFFPFLCIVLIELFSTACNQEVVQLEKLKLLQWQSLYEPNNSWIFENDSCFEYFENDLTFAAKYQLITPDTAQKPYIVYFFGGTEQFLRIDTLNNRMLVLFHIESLNQYKFKAQSKNQRTR